MTKPINHPERITAELRPRAPRLRHVITIPTWCVIAGLLAFIATLYLVVRI